jgi:RimJ/RimL family protein N-acetyltransferase
VTSLRGDDVLILALNNQFRRIRDLNHEDVPTLMDWDNDPDLFALTGKKFHQDITEHDWWDNLIRDRTRLMFAIVDDCGRLIGDVEILQILWRAREAEVRISIGDKSFWNRGFGTEALNEALYAAFHFLSLDRVYLRVRVDNLRAIKSYQKAGFRSVGRLEPTGRLSGQTALQLMEVTRHHFFPESARA